MITSETTMLKYISPNGGSKMYYEGASHPLYRGTLHGLFSTFIPFGWIMIYNKSKNELCKFIFFVYMFFSFMLYVCSYIYHVHSYKYGMYVENIFLKLDRAFTLLSISSNFTPVAILFLHKTGQYLLFIQWSLSFYGLLNIFVFNRTIWYEPIVIGSVYLLFLDEMKKQMTSYEYNMMHGSCIISLIGGIIYGMEINLPATDTNVWGYHENFHICTILAEIMVYILNYNMACRISLNEKTLQ